MKQGKKYIAVDTWNGEGYSSDNGVDIIIFDTKKKADAYCKTAAYKHKEEDFISVEKVDNGYEFTADDDSGSYRYYELPEDAYAVEILCNINEVRILNQKEFSKAIADREAEIVDADVYRGDYAFATEDGVFYSAVGDYDFQYRRINS